MIPCTPHTFTFPILNSEDDFQVAELDYETAKLNLRNGEDNSAIHTAHARIVSTKCGRYESTKAIVQRLQDEIKALTENDSNNTHSNVNIDSGEQNEGSINGLLSNNNHQGIVRGNGEDDDDKDGTGESSDDLSSKSSSSYGYGYGYGYHGKEDSNTLHVDEGSKQSYYDQDSVCDEEEDYLKKVSNADIDKVDKESTICFEDAFY